MLYGGVYACKHQAKINAILLLIGPGLIKAANSRVSRPTGKNA
jgi:hypothetical protein